MKKKNGVKIIKKTGIVLIVTMMMGSMVACGSSKEAPTQVPTEESQSITEAVTETMITEEKVSTAASTAEGGLANFDADPEAVKAFAQQVQEIVAKQDIQGLAELMVFPNYVSSYDKNDGIVNTKEEFTAISADTIFTKDMIDSIASADISKLEASMAGFVLVSKDSATAPSITFSDEDGKGEFKIVGINY